MVGYILYQINKSLVVIIISIFACCIFFSSSIYALTVNDAVEKIVNDSPELRIILEKRMQAVDNYKIARADYLPTFYLDYIRTYQKDSPITDPTLSDWTGSNQFEAILEQKIFDMSSLANIERSSFLVQSQEFENQKLLENLIQLAVTAYFDVINAEYVMAVNNEYYTQLQDIEKLILNMRKQGNATLGDVNLIESKVASANTNLLGSRASLDKSKMTLAYLLNLVSASDTNVNIDNILPDLTNKDFYDLADKMISFMPISIDEFQKEAIRNNIDILLIRSNLCAAGYSLEGQKNRWLPTVNLTVTLDNEQDKSNPNTVQKYGRFQIDTKYYIYDGGARGAGIQSAESAIRELEYNYDVQIRETRNQAYANFNQLKSLNAQRASVLQQIEAAQEVDRIYKQQFKFGTRNLTDRLDNLQSLNDAKIKLISIDYSVLTTRMETLILLGQFVQFFGFQNYLDYNNLNLC